MSRAAALASLVLLLAGAGIAFPEAVTLRTPELAAVFDKGCLVAVRNLLTGERYFAASNPEDTIGLTLQSGMLPAGKVLRSARVHGGYRWEMTSTGPEPARVSTIVERAGPGLLIRQTVHRAKGGIGGAEWGLRGVSFAAGKLIIPAAGGVVVNPARTSQDITYEWPGSWQAAAVFIQGKRGGIWLWTDDPLRRFKDLRYRRRGQTATLRFATETDGPAGAYREFESVTWHLAAYRGDWRKPAAQYRALMARSYRLASLPRRQPAWVSNIGFVVKADPALPLSDLQRLAREVSPGRTLIYLPNWRTYGYDENYPEYEPLPDVVSWVKTARRLGFHVMLHFNWAGINPGHPLREKYDRMLLRYRWTGERAGWYLDRPSDTAHQIVVLDLAFPEARRLLIDRIVKAQQAAGCDAIHLDFPVLVNSTQGRHNGMNPLQGAEAYLRELREALPEVALGTEGMHEVLLQCSFAQVGEFFWNADRRMGDIHPVRSYIFSPFVHLYGHLGMPDPVDSLASYADALDLGLRMAALPTLPTHGGGIHWEAPGVKLALEMGRIWTSEGLAPDFDLRPDEAMAWRGDGGSRVSFRRERSGWALRQAEEPVLLMAEGANALPAPWSVPGWPAQDSLGIFGLDPHQRYLALPGLRRPPGGVHLARPAQPLVLESFCQGEKRASLRLARARTEVWRADPAMGSARELVLKDGRLAPLADGASFSLSSAPCHGERRPVIFAHPPWKGESAGGMTVGEFRVALPRTRNLTLRFSTGLADIVHDPRLANAGDGVTFVVSVNGKRLFQRHQDRDRGWQAHDVPLDAYAGKKVTLHLATGPGPAGDTSYDWACWNDVRIDAGGGGQALDFDVVSARQAVATLPEAIRSGSKPYRYHFAGQAASQWAALLFECQSVALPARIADLPFSVAAVSRGLGQDGSVFGSGSIGQMEMRGTSLRAISGHPPNQGQTHLDWALALPPQPCLLRFRYGVRDGGQSVVFSVLVNGEALWSQPVPEPQGWKDAELDLGRWAGKTILLGLVTDSDGSNNCDWALWGEPSLEARGN